MCTISSWVCQKNSLTIFEDGSPAPEILKTNILSSPGIKEKLSGPMVSRYIILLIIETSLVELEHGRTMVKQFFLSEVRPVRPCSTCSTTFDLLDHVRPPVDPASYRSMLVIHSSEPREALIRGGLINNQGRVRVSKNKILPGNIGEKKIYLPMLRKKNILLTTYPKIFFYFNNNALWTYGTIFFMTDHS